MRDVAGTRCVLAGGVEVERVSPVMEGVDLWWMRVGEQSAAWLSVEERERMGRFRFAADQRGFLAKRVLARAVLSEYAGAAPGSWRFAVDAWGKPRVEGSGLEFSLARSGEMVVCAVSRDGLVGVDVEDMHARPDEEMPEGALAPGESAVVRRLAGAARREAFLEFWTLKEALGKGLGCGLPGLEAGFAVTGEWGFEQGRIGGRYVVAVAVSTSDRRSFESADHDESMICFAQDDRCLRAPALWGLYPALRR